MLIPFNIESAKSGCPVVTRHGTGRVEILKYNLEGDRPLVGVVYYSEYHRSVELWYENGKQYEDGRNSNLDLFILK